MKARRILARRKNFQKEEIVALIGDFFLLIEHICIIHTCNTQQINFLFIKLVTAKETLLDDGVESSLVRKLKMWSNRDNTIFSEL